jgi:hypothetical protein
MFVIPVRKLCSRNLASLRTTKIDASTIFIIEDSFFREIDVRREINEKLGFNYFMVRSF